MTQLSLDVGAGKHMIKAYEPGCIKINDTEYTTSSLVSADTVISPWAPKSIHDLTVDACEQIIQLQPQVVLLGTGEQLIHPEQSLLSPLIEQKIGFEVMDNAAACRTYNVVLAEGRRVVAAIIIG